MRVLFVEPWFGGSHRQLANSLEANGVTLVPATLPARHWKWRMRGSAVAMAGHPAIAAATGGSRRPDLLLASSYLPLAELLGLVPGLSDIPRVLFFHENQLAYPMRPEFSGERDLHYGFTQLISALAAHECWFNSAHNRDSFLEAGGRLLRAMPDAAPRDWIDRVAARSHVTYLPLTLPDRAARFDEGGVPDDRRRGPLILWNHRWEHDKNPELFFEALSALHDDGVPFRLAVCGPRFQTAPPVFANARTSLASHVVHWGSVDDDDPEAYWSLLERADIVVSTADHEFFGVSVLEAVHAGARPWVPDRLAYVETIPDRFRWADRAALIEGLRTMCRGYVSGQPLRADRADILAPFRAQTLVRAMLARAEALCRSQSQD